MTRVEDAQAKNSWQFPILGQFLKAPTLKGSSQGGPGPLLVFL